MPIYEYENEVTGKTEEHLRAVEDRDAVPEHLRRVVSLPGIVVAATPEATAEEKARRGLAKLEDRMGARELERQIGYPSREVKQAWRDDDEW